MNEQTDTINHLTLENYIWGIFILIAVANIVGDELIKDSITEHNRKKDSLAKNIFIITLIVTILIYLYFLSRNYHDYQSHKDEVAYEIGFLGSIFTIVGVLCFLYFQIKITTSDDSVSSI